MKKLLLMLAFILPAMISSSCSSDEVDENSTPGEKRLTEVRAEEYEYKFGELEEYGDLYELYKYDSKGNLTQKETYYYIAAWGDRVPRKFIYKYDDNNRMIEHSEYQFSLLEYRYFYTYNSIDSISEMKIYDDDGDLDETWTYEYDSNKRKIKATEIINWMSNDYGYRHEYSYSSNTITDKSYNLDDGSLFGITVDEYDNYGNLLLNTWTNGETGKTTEQEGHTYSYNSKGQIIKKRHGV